MSLSIILFVSILCISVAQYSLSVRNYRRTIESTANSIASVLSPVNVQEFNPSYMTSFIMAVFKEKVKVDDIFFLFQDLDNGEVFHSSEEELIGTKVEDIAGMSPRPSFSFPLDIKEAQFSWSSDLGFVYISTPFLIKKEKRIISAQLILRVKTSKFWNDLVKEYVELVGLIALIVFVLGLAIFFQLREHFLLPLEQITDVISKRLTGDTSAFVPVTGEDEIGMIGNALNKMLMELGGTLKTLAKSQERYELAVSGASISVWTWDLSQDEITWAGYSSVLFGVESNKSLPRRSKDLFQRIHNEDAKKLRKKLEEAFDTEGTIDLELRIKDYAGKYIWVSTRGQVTTDSQGLKKASGIFYDITLRKIAESQLAKAKEEAEKAVDALTESENRLALAVETTTDGLWEWNLKTDEAFFSQRFKSLLGYKRDDMMFPKTFDALRARVHPEDIGRLDKTIEEHMRSGDSFSIEYRIKNKEGKYSYFRFKGGAQKDGTGKVVRMAGSNTDIASEKRNEIKLKQYASDLEQAIKRAETATQAKSQFLANMSHEIRTPLNGIIATTSLLERTKMTNRQNKYVDTISESGDMLLHILNDVLDYSKIEAGKMELSFTPFDLRSLLSGIRTLFLSQAQAKGLNLKIEEEGDIVPFAVGDKVRIRQVIINLVSNAVKYTTEGTITIGLSIPTRKKNDFLLRCAVKDTGAGISKDLQEAVFKKFVQVEGTKEQSKGTGLGLAISYSLVNLMNGKIGLDSDEGKGSVFWFEIPLFYASEEDLTIQETRSRQGKEEKSQGQVLLVEDVLANQFIIGDMLEQLGCEVDVAANGEEALEKLGKNTYGLVFMDCNMPVMNGLEATEIWRKKERREHIRKTPIIALTAHAFQEEQDHCFQVGMDDFISKPLKYEDLFAAVKKWLTVSHRKNAVDVAKGMGHDGNTSMPDIDVDLEDSAEN